jgi:toxin ParE1/3/4
MAKYLITRQAQNDINEILHFIAADNLNAAVAFADRLTELFELLAGNSKVGRERPDLQEGIRSFPEGNYVIFYRTWAGEVAIVRILHGARDLEELFPEID